MRDFLLPNRRRFLATSGALATTLVLRGRVGGQDRRATARAKAAKDLFIHTEEPLNAEPELSELVQAQITPIEHFYVRNHGPTPKLKAEEVKLQIGGLVNRPLELSVGEVREKYAKQTVEATLTCAGNRREEHNAAGKVGGVQWRAGAIGNAHWEGASLAELLKQAELRPGAKHVWFEGLDSIKERDGTSAPFGGSIPLERALAGDNGSLALVAYQMNDQPLLAEHGFPLRTIVPGFIGARSVKWLTKITVSDRPSPNHYVADAYKLIQKEADAKDRDPIYHFPINSAICVPAEGAKLRAGQTKIAGYALPTGEPGCTIAKVELSLDGGKSWREAKLDGGTGSDKAAGITWQLWSTEIELPAGKHTLTVRATDSLGNQQPARPEWNMKGYLFNGWQRVAVEVSA